MNSQNRTHSDFFSNSHPTSDNLFQTSNIEGYHFEDQNNTTAKNQKNDTSEADSCSYDEEEDHRTSYMEFFPPISNPSVNHDNSLNLGHEQSDRRSCGYNPNISDSQVGNLLTLPKRKSNICLSRENIMRHWTSSDDDELMNLADQYKNDWKKIAKRIISSRKKKVTPNFLKNRYKEIAGDHIKKGVKFTHEEDLQIAKLFEIHGTSWTAIAYHFQDRTPVMIKNRYYSHIRRKGLLLDLVSEAQGKVKNSEDFDNSDDFIGSPSSFQNSTQAYQGENQENSVNHDSLEAEDGFSKVNFIISDQPFLGTHRIDYFGDEGLCNLHNNNHEDLLNVRVTDYKFSDSHFQF